MNDQANAKTDETNKRRLGGCHFPHQFEIKTGSQNAECVKCHGTLPNQEAVHYMDGVKRFAHEPPWGKKRGPA